MSQENSSDGYDPFDEVYVPRDKTYAGVGGNKETLVIAERKPNDQEWFRVHPDREMHQRVFIFTDKVSSEKGSILAGKTYLVLGSVAREPVIASRIREAVIYPVMTRQNALLVWVIVQAQPGKDWNDYPKSATMAAEIAMTQWILLQNIGGSYGYETWPVDGTQLPPPSWPKLTGKELLKKAFTGRVIDSVNHPIVQALTGHA
jgi:hypothetical protein